MKIKLFTIILLIPIIHVLANITTNYYEAGTINPGFARMVFMVFVIALFFIKSSILHKNIAWIIFIFLSYNFCLVLLNEDLLGPLITFTKMALPFFMIFIGYAIIKDREKSDNLFKVYIIALFMVFLNYFVANVFGLGESTYLENSFYLGGSSAGQANEISIFVLIGIIFLLVNYEKKWRIFSFIVMGAGLIIMILILRRGAFLTLGTGLLVLLLLTGVKRKILKYCVVFGTLLALLFPFYGDTLIERYEHRASKRGSSLLNYKVEGRYKEISWVTEEIKTEGIGRILFGTHNLNSAAYFERRGFGRRELHVGYMAIFHGSGLVGLFLFFAVILALIKKEKEVYRHIKGIYYYRQLHALFYALILALFTYLLTSRLHGFTVTVPVFLMLGGLIGTMKEGCNSLFFSYPSQAAPALLKSETFESQQSLS